MTCQSMNMKIKRLTSGSLIIFKNVPILKLDTEDALYEIQHIRHPIRSLSEFVSVKEFTKNE